MVISLNAKITLKNICILISISLITIPSASPSKSVELFPEICGGLYPPEFELKLVRNAFEEALRKKIDLSNYHSSFAVLFESKSNRKRKIWAVRFSPFYCNSKGFDGGGFDVEFDLETLKIIDSYVSEL